MTNHLDPFFPAELIIIIIIIIFSGYQTQFTKTEPLTARQQVKRTLGIFYNSSQGKCRT